MCHIRLCYDPSFSRRIGKNLGDGRRYSPSPCSSKGSDCKESFDHSRCTSTTSSFAHTHDIYLESTHIVRVLHLANELVRVHLCRAAFMPVSELCEEDGLQSPTP